MGFHPSDKDKSGIDAEINIVHGITRTGLFLKCQLKAGRSYISSETDEALRVRIESKYLTHWYDSNVQIALFFYEPLTQSVYWKDIRDHLQAHSNLLSGTQETRIIEFRQKMDLLTPETLPVLEQVARGCHFKICRPYILHQFPFSIVYTNSPARIIVLAVAHAHRRPGYWRKRLQWQGPDSEREQ